MERVLANKANYLVRKGHEVIIVTTEQKGRPSFFSLDERIQCYDLAIGYEDNNGKSIWNKLLHYPYKQYIHKERLNALLKKLRADIVISMFCNDVFFLPEIKDSSKKILEIHFSRFKELQYGRTGLWKWADAWRSKRHEQLAQRFHRFVVLTKEDAGYWGNLSNIRIIPNARTFEPRESSALLSSKVIAIGRYSTQKGFDRLIDIWTDVCKTDTAWHLDIIGDGELRESLQLQIERLNLQQRITLKPSTLDVATCYREASILAMTSRYEGLPMALLEAQAFGLPIVSYTCKCGPRDVITDGQDGFLVEEENSSLFAERLLTLMNDRAMRQQMGNAALHNSERYAEEKVMAQWLSLFNEING